MHQGHTTSEIISNLIFSFMVASLLGILSIQDVSCFNIDGEFDYLISIHLKELIL